MDKKEKKIIVVLPFIQCQYTTEEITYLMPGIIHKEFENNKVIFDDLVRDSLLFYFYNEDKGAYCLKTSYYENLSDVISGYLLKLGKEKLFGNY